MWQTPLLLNSDERTQMRTQLWLFAHGIARLAESNSRFSSSKLKIVGLRFVWSNYSDRTGFNLEFTDNISLLLDSIQIIRCALGRLATDVFKCSCALHLQSAVKLSKIGRNLGLHSLCLMVSWNYSLSLCMLGVLFPNGGNVGKATSRIAKANFVLANYIIYGAAMSFDFCLRKTMVHGILLHVPAFSVLSIFHFRCRRSTCVV